ncbi:hypothetical protein [Streptomyces sp. NBC_00448]|uniref:hypothetical protein n=1 Tax=Streptomyces sp. NBC_00448 TaxID=2903652 RepID=UPI002E1A144E
MSHRAPRTGRRLLSRPAIAGALLLTGLVGAVTAQAEAAPPLANAHTATDSGMTRDEARAAAEASAKAAAAQGHGSMTRDQARAAAEASAKAAAAQGH